VNRLLRVASVLAVLPTLGGCAALAHTMFPCPVPNCPPGRMTRETPEDALEFLIDAFKNRRIGDIYDTFHPAFVRENGDFTKEQFSVAYEHFEQDFLADAESLSHADSGWMAPTQVEIRGVPATLSGVRLRNPQNGAEIVFALQNRPKLRVVTNDRFVGLIEGPIEKDVVVRLSNGTLSLPADIPLTSIENVAPESVAPLSSANVVRVEITDDWLVRFVPPDKAKNIRFMDKIKEHIGR
jgi:hypothetical protein